MWEDYKLKLIIEAQDKFSAELKKMKWDIEQIQTTANKTSWSVTNIISWIKKWIAWLWIASIFYKWISAIWEATEKLQEYEWQVERLRVLTENSTGATKSMTDELIKQAEAIDKVWVATKEWIVSAQSQFATFDMSTQAIKELIPAFTDYVIAEKWANATTEEYISMANGLAQALNGNYASLTRTWFILDEDTKKIIENWTEMERVRAIVEVLNSTYEWFNEKLSHTAEWLANIRAKEREAEFQAIAEKTRDIADSFDEAKTTFVNMLWSMMWVTTKTNDEVVLLKDNIHDLKDAVAQLDAEWKNWEISAWEYLKKLKDLKEQTKEQEEELERQEDWLINVEKAQKELEIATISIKQAYESWNITLEEAQRALEEVEKQQERLTSAEELWADATQWQMDALTRFRNLEKEVEEATKNLATAEREYANLKADKSATKSELDSMKSKVDSLKTSLIQLQQAEQNALGSIPYAPIQWAISKDLLQKYAEDFTQSLIIKKPTNSWWWSGWSWKSDSEAKKQADAEKKYQEQLKKELIWMQKAHKEYIKQKEKDQADYYKKVDSESREMFKRQWEVLTDLVKEYKDKFDDIQDHIKDTEKEIKKLTKNIEDIKESLNNLTVDENKSLAKEFLNAKEIAKDLEKEFAWIGNIAENISRDELNNAIDTDFIWWYAVSNIKKMKTALEEVNWLYDWLSDEQRKQLEDQVAYQEWYNWLNPVEQIKEDYKVRRDEINKELKEKEDALEEEKTKLEKFQEEQAKLQEEYLWKIQDARETYDKMYEDILKFEKDYQILFDNDMFKQQKAVRELKDLWNDVADAKSKAIAYWTDIEWRASWWYVAWWTPYLVWENWPELFVPKNNWTIIPNNEIVNNNWITINVSWVSVRNDNDIQTITDEIIRKIKLEKTFWIA